MKNLTGPATVNPNRGKKVALLAVAAILTSLLSLYFTMRPSPPPVSRTPFLGFGEVLADETIKAIESHGTVVPVIATYHSTGGTPVSDIWNTFAKEIKKHSGVILAEPVIVKLDAMAGEATITRSDFDNLVARHGSASALVLLVGLPVWDANQPLTLPHSAPKIIAVHFTPLSAKPYFIHSIATTLITPRLVPATAGAGETLTPRQWFDQNFQIFTAQNYESLPN